MQRYISCLFLAMLIMLSVAALQAQEPQADSSAPVIDVSKTPWLEGVTIPNKPSHPSPVVPAEIIGPDGGAVPATLTEDVPILLTVISDIFAEKPPSEWKGVPLPEGEWVRKPSVRWFFDDVTQNRSTMASVAEDLPENQMKVTPLDPTQQGAVTVMLARPMQYKVGPDSYQRTFVNSSRSLLVKVVDITPPVCGLEITVGPNKGTVYPIENPPHKYPLPKLADVICEGSLFGLTDEDEHIVIEGIELGKHMVLPEKAALHLAKDAVIKLKPLLSDNQKVDEKSVMFGISNGAGDVPAPLGLVNAEEIKLAELNLPKEPYLFIKAADITGNLETLYIPIKVK